ncbi:hypothetical protein TW95_gp0695 [Pandoravirus inopinatum]|uniref:Uncharacterized protein n=1 Tax=Pandoravirus inopinatum TaxID=1605721 RepID=A0A0B5J1N3_9VIRU|nr:hypothetical protein TW95_gp0695 [Pandoravirus inopinatum]AJF97429.1 hypothetical protein [Pandoravirus inopinatum]
MEQSRTMTVEPPVVPVHEIVMPPLSTPAGGRALLRHAFPQHHRTSVFHDRTADVRRAPKTTKKKKGKDGEKRLDKPAKERPVRMPTDAVVDLLMDHLIDAGAIHFDRDSDRLSGVRFEVDALMLCHNACTALVHAMATSLVTHFVSPGQRAPDPLLASLGDDMGRLAVLVSVRSGLSLVESVPAWSAASSCVLLVSSLDGDAVHRTVRHLRNKGLDVLGLFVLFSSQFLHDTERLQALGLPAVVLTNVAMAVDRAHLTGRLSAADVRRAHDIYAPRII